MTIGYAESMYALKKCVILYDLELSPTNFIDGHCISSDHRLTVSQVRVRLGQEKRKYAPDKDFLYNFAMNFSFDLETFM